MYRQALLKPLLFLKVLIFLSCAITCFSADEKYAVIFDCDGVLVNSEPLKHQAWQTALQEINVDFTIEDYKSLMGHSGAHIAQSIQKLKSIPTPWKDFMNRRNAVYEEIHANGAPQIEPAVVCLKSIMDRKSPHFKLGLASSPCRKEILRNLKAIGLDEYAFDAVVSGKDDLLEYTDATGTK